MSKHHPLIAATLACAAAACVVSSGGAGSAFGPGSSSTASGAAATTDDTAASGAASTEASPDTGGTDRDQALVAAQRRTPPARPAAPDDGLDGTAPRVMPADAERFGFYNHGPADCSAAHDHCLPAWAWIAEPADSTAKAIRIGQSAGRGRTADRPWVFGRGMTGYDDGIALVAYRTVPATPSLARPGALAFALEYPQQQPDSELTAMQADWRIGVIESVDLADGKVRLVGHADPYWLSATRVGAIRLGADGRIDRLVTGGDLAGGAPPIAAPRGGAADPWAAIDSAGQPRAQPDRAPLEAVPSVPCDAAHDHCLRPWAWFTLDGNRPMVVRRVGDAFKLVNAIDDYTDLTAKDYAYRTVPATAANLAPGGLVFFRHHPPPHEGDAHREPWESGTVATVNPAAGTFTVRGDSRSYALAAARVAVVRWFPGERAEAMAP